MKRETRIMFLVAILTFAGLSAISAGIWAVTRDGEPATATQAAAIPAAAPAVAEEHDHEHPTDFPRIKIDELKTLVEKGAVTVIDVRSAEQYIASHIPGALQIPLTLVEGEIPHLPKDKPIVTYCSCPAEETSGQAALILQNGGIVASALEGGFQGWVDRGYPTASGVK